MTTTRRVRSWANATVAGLNVVDIAVAVLLSVYAVFLTAGALHPYWRPARGGVVGASIGVLAMTVPVAWRRRAPIAAAAVLGGGAVLNGVVFGHMVRCGPCLPAVFLVGYAVGAYCDRTRAGVGLALCAINVAAQSVYDPRLGAPVMVIMIPVLAAFFALGRNVRARAAAADTLRQQTEELRRQRQETARLTVMADRARLSDELDSTLRGQLDRIATTAAAGREALGEDSAATREALVSIEHDGREVLRQMREIVGTLDEAPSEPQPSLAELSALLSRATTATARLTIEGDARRLPAGVELSGYRIVEHLLVALADTPDAIIDVRLCFGVDAFELHVSGPPARHVELPVVLAAARQRAALHAGVLDGRIEGGLCHATARVPLISGYA
jgi:signal transduction histidine kinase